MMNPKALTQSAGSLSQAVGRCIASAVSLMEAATQESARTECSRQDQTQRLSIGRYDPTVSAAPA